MSTRPDTSGIEVYAIAAWGMWRLVSWSRMYQDPKMVRDLRCQGGPRWAKVGQGGPRVEESSTSHPAQRKPSETTMKRFVLISVGRLVHIDLAEYGKAIDGFTQALEKRLATPYKAQMVAGSFGQAFFHRGICYRRVGRISESIQNLKEAINLDTTSAEAHNHLGLSHIQEKHFEEARSCFANAVELDPCSRRETSGDVLDLDAAPSDATPAEPEQPTSAELPSTSRPVGSLLRRRRKDESKEETPQEDTAARQNEKPEA
eukprot:Skav218297  [mRNA]  locus=scaffold2388:98116:105063:+ [translate_table: standard]